MGKWIKKYMMDQETLITWTKTLGNMDKTLGNMDKNIRKHGQKH